MNDKTKNATNGTLYRVNYSWVNKTNQFRNGSLAITATSAEEATTKGQEMLNNLAIRHGKITSAKPY